MRRIVSDSRYTYFIEKTKDDIECTIFETGKHMRGKLIAEELKITPSAVSYHIKNAVQKIYKELRRRNLSPSEVVCSMCEVFNLDTVCEYNHLLNLFPTDIRSEIYAEAEKAA